KRRSSHIVIAKLVVAASAYFIWQERNWRLFKKTKRTVNQVIECIKSAVRLKLLSCSFKRSSEGVRYARMWDLPDTIFKFEALVQKLIDEDKVRQNAILDLALQFENACTAKDDLRKAYEKCNDIPQESRALIDTFLKEGSDKDYELNLSMYGKAAKLEKQMNAKLAWLLKKYNYRSQTHIGCSSSQADLYLTEKKLHQLHLDEEALRETLEEKAMDEKAREEKIRQKQTDDDEFFMKFGVVKYDSESD
ncbi:hypothetical protein Tco_0543690, partial [Tanacetum coccineum]